MLVDARTEYLSTSHDVAVSQSRVRAPVLGDLRRWTGVTVVSCDAVHGEWHSVSVEKDGEPTGFGSTKTRTPSPLFSRGGHSPPWKLLEVAQGVHYIHSEGVIHGSLRGVLYLHHSIVGCSTHLLLLGQHPVGCRPSRPNLRLWVNPTFRTTGGATLQLSSPRVIQIFRRRSVRF